MTSLRKSHVFVIIGCVCLALVVGAIAWLARDDVEPKRVFEHAGEPGDLVSIEPWRGVYAADFEIWKIAYVTTDRHGNTRTATALVSAAANRTDAKVPIVAFAHGTVGVAEDCAPSDRSKPLASDAGAVAAIVAQGAVAVAPDYSGLGSEGPHGYLVGEEAAHDVLDAVRAVRQIPDVNVSKKTVVWGQSQGGHAALWAGIEQPTYAPEIDLAGIVATAPPTDLSGMLADSPDPIAAMLHAYLLDSWRQVYPDSGVWEEVSEANRKVIPEVAGSCLTNNDALISELDPPVLPDHAKGTPLRKLLDANEVDRPIEAPVMVAQGSNDTLVPAANQRAWVQEQCAAGATIDYREYADTDHYTVIYAMLPDLLTWTVDRFEGKPAPNTC